MKRFAGTLVVVMLAGCGSSSDTPTADEPTLETTASTESTGSAAPVDMPEAAEPVATTDLGPGPSGVAEGLWTVAFQRVTPDVLACSVSTGPDGISVDVAARGSISGGARVEIRVVDNPPSSGPAALRIDLVDDGVSFDADVVPLGVGTVEIGDLFWETFDGRFILLGSFPVPGGDVAIDLEVACDGATPDGSTDIDGDSAANTPGAPCAALPTENIPNGYPDANVPAIETRLAGLADWYEAVDGRYCVTDDGDIWYFLVFDFPADGFHALDVCGTIFNRFEGDFERAALAYTDDLKFCG